MNRIPNIADGEASKIWDFGFGVWNLLRTSRGRFFAVAILFIFSRSALAAAAEVVPPSPSPHYIVDQAHVISPQALQLIDGQLQQFERNTSNQIVVAIYSKIPKDESLGTYALWLCQAWRVGQQRGDKGALIVVSVEDHAAAIATDHGLSTVLSADTCKQIAVDEMGERFKLGDYEGGLRAGIHATIAATNGLYSATPDLDDHTKLVLVILAVVVVVIVLSNRLRMIYGETYFAGGRVPRWTVPFILFASFAAYAEENAD